MNDLFSVVDWSRAQFALTAMYHWLFVPLTLGLSVIVSIMETIYYRTGNEKWLKITKFWMTLFGINFAVGVATGIILEFEFGTNWSNYSWFVGDIFGAPLAIEGLLAFFMEATFIAVMFFGWGKVSKGFHLASCWLTALGTTISAFWILVANSWMQYPVGMEFDPAQMRNVMQSFSEVAFNQVVINKFLHTVMSGWTLSALFVIGVSGWLLMKKRNNGMAILSIKVAVWFGIVGMLATMGFGDGSAKVVAKVQPMKLAAMEGLYDGGNGVEIVGFGVLNPDKNVNTPEADDFLFKIAIPKGLSFLATGDFDGYVPGINDLINGTSGSQSYQERIICGKMAHEALRQYDAGYAANDTALMARAQNVLDDNFSNFGYGYFDKPEEAVPNVPITFYAFHLMVLIGGYLLAFLFVVAFLVYRTEIMQKSRILQWLAIAGIPLVWICSECGWITAEVGRQPWIIEGLMPTRAAVSAISSGSVQFTFWLFAFIFTSLLIAEISIMLRYIHKKSLIDIVNQ